MEIKMSIGEFHHIIKLNNENIVRLKKFKYFYI